jgi:hypothetical protein
VDCRNVCPVFLTEPGSEIPFLLYNENEMADNQGWQEKNKTPGKVKGERNACQKENTAKIQRIPREREDTRGNDLARGKPGIRWLRIAGKLPAGKNDKAHAHNDQNNTCGDDSWREEPAWQ